MNFVLLYKHLRGCSEDRVFYVGLYTPYTFVNLTLVFLVHFLRSVLGRWECFVLGSSDNDKNLFIITCFIQTTRPSGISESP